MHLLACNNHVFLYNENRVRLLMALCTSMHPDLHHPNA